MAYGRVDVSVCVVPKQPPDTAVRLKRDVVLLAGGVEQEGNHCIARDVAGDVLFGVVGSHLLLVDVLLEDVAEYVRVNLVVLPVWSLVQMPAIAVEEIEDPLKCGVRYGNVGVVALQVVYVEQTPLRKGTLPRRAASSGARWASGWPRPSWKRRSRKRR